MFAGEGAGYAEVDRNRFFRASGDTHVTEKNATAQIAEGGLHRSPSPTAEMVPETSKPGM